MSVAAEMSVAAHTGRLNPHSLKPNDDQVSFPVLGVGILRSAADPALSSSDESAPSDLPNPIPGVSPEKEEEGDEAAQSIPKTHECSAGCNDPFGDRREFMTSALYFAGKDLRIGVDKTLSRGLLGWLQRANLPGMLHCQVHSGWSRHNRLQSND